MEIKPTQIKWDQIPKDWMVQPKYDGECNKLIIKKLHWTKNDGVASLQRFEGRNKTDFYPEIIEGLTGQVFQADMVLVGEVCVLMNELVASFPHIQLRMNTQNKVKQKLAMKDKLVTFMAFDIEEYDGKNLDKVPYGERYSIMQQALKQKVTWKDGQPSARIMPVKNISLDGWVDQLDSPIDYTWKEFVKEHEMEGIVVKNPDKAAEQVKLKNWDEDDFKIIGTETTEAGEARGWFISKLRLEDTKGTHVNKGQQFDCKYINYPQTKQAKKDVIGKTAIIKYMKMRGRDGQYLAPRHPSLVEILEFK